MMRVLAILMLLAGPALAADPVPPAPPAFVPIVIDQAKAEQIEKSLLDKRHDYALAVEAFLSGLEQEAQQAAREAAKDKAAKK